MERESGLRAAEEGLEKSGSGQNTVLCMLGVAGTVIGQATIKEQLTVCQH